jgi:hypothetical protein
MTRRPPISGVIFNERGRPMATIEVTLAVSVDGVEVRTVTADGVEVSVKNPQSAKPKDTVTWVFTSGPDNLKVVFNRVQFPNGSGGLLPIELQPLNERGPFYKPLSRSGNEISSTIAPDAPRGRHIYEIRDGNNNPLTWLTPLEGQNFGGLDIPRTPPG